MAFAAANGVATANGNGRAGRAGRAGLTIDTGSGVDSAQSMLSGPVDALTEIGQTGLNRVSGFVYEELLPELKGEKGKKAIRTMIDEDPVIGAILYITEMLCRQVTWDVAPATNTNKDQEIADFVKDALFEDMSITWQDSISEIMTFVPWGYQFTEVTYKQRLGQTPPTYKNALGVDVEQAESMFDDGKIGIRKLSPRAQETTFRWVFDANGGTRGMVQMAPPHFRFVEIPIEKALLFRTTARKGNPEGRPMLRNIYTSWYYKRQLQRIEAIGIERDLAGLPIAWVPPAYLGKNANGAQITLLNDIKKIVTGVRRDEQEGMVFPLAYDRNGNKMFDFTLLSTGGSRSFDTSAIIERYDKRMAQAMMAEFIMLGMDKVGSFALASSKTNLFAIGLGTFLDAICEVFNRYLIKKLMIMNGFPLESRPKLTHGDIENIPLDEIAQFLTAASGAGAPLFPSQNGDLEKWVLERIGAPVPEEFVAPIQGNGEQNPADAAGNDPNDPNAPDPGGDDPQRGNNPGRTGNVGDNKGTGGPGGTGGSTDSGGRAKANAERMVANAMREAKRRPRTYVDTFAGVS